MSPSMRYILVFEETTIRPHRLIGMMAIHFILQEGGGILTTISSKQKLPTAWQSHDDHEISDEGAWHMYSTHTHNAYLRLVLHF